MTANALQTKQARIVEAFANNVDTLTSVLPKHVTPEKLVRIISHEIRSNPDLAQCTTVSLMSAVIQGSMYGLEIGSTKGHAYLVPYKRTATLVVGYKGFVWLALNSREVKKIEARCVFKGDVFSYEYGLHPTITHVPNSERTTDFDELTHAYSIAWLANGETMFDVMTRDEILRIRDDKAKAKGGPWKSDPIEMARKCPIRRLAKLLPLQLLQEVATMDEQHDEGNQESLTDFLEGEFNIINEDQPEPQPRGNEAGKEALKKQENKRAKKPEAPTESPQETLTAGPGQHIIRNEIVDDPQAQLVPDNAPNAFEQFDIQINEIDEPEHVKGILAKLAASDDLSDTQRQELERRAHARAQKLSTATSE